MRLFNSGDQTFVYILQRDSSMENASSVFYVPSLDPVTFNPFRFTIEVNDELNHEQRKAYSHVSFFSRAAS